MTRNSTLLLMFVLMIAPAVALATAQPDAITGFWKTADGDAVIHITAGDNGYQGALDWLREATYAADDARGMGGQPVVDRHNVDPSKRDRPLRGLTIVTGLHYTEPDLDDEPAKWRDGRIYNTNDGRHYDCYVWLDDINHLKLRGYVGSPLFGKTTTWTRVADPSVD